MLPSRSGILAKAINIMHLISIKQQNEEGNTLRTDPSNNQGKLNSYLKLVLFLLPWPILMRTDCKTPNFRTLSILPCQWTQWK